MSPGKTQGPRIVGGVFVVQALPLLAGCEGPPPAPDFGGCPVAERTDRPGWTGVVVDGTCAPTSEIATTVLDLPAMTLRNVALTCGFDVTTSTGVNGDVSLHGSRPGTMTYPGYAASILVFNTYDCAGACGTRNWVELHAIMWDPTRNQVGFQIWYLDPVVPGVLTDNTIVLPPVTSLDVSFPDATWQLNDRSDMRPSR